MAGRAASLTTTSSSYRESRRESVSAALTRASATLVSFELCLIYLPIFAFHPLELVVLIGLAAFPLSLAGRPHDWSPQRSPWRW
jgi:hypothetical protein